MPERGATLVTGALGCVGAWTVRALLDDGDECRVRPRRLRPGCGWRSPTSSASVTRVAGDVTDLARARARAGRARRPRVIHLAALQVPFCARTRRSARPSTWSAPSSSSRRRAAAPTASRTSSTRARRPSTPPPTLHRSRVGRPRPRHALRRHKLANEGMARVFRRRAGSLGVRPYVVYGPGTRPGHDVHADPGDGRGGARRELPDHVRRHLPVRLRAGRGPGARESGGERRATAPWSPTTRACRRPWARWSPRSRPPPPRSRARMD